MTERCLQLISDEHSTSTAQPHTPAASRRGRFSLFLGLLLLLLAAATFAPVGQHDFVGWDDDVHVYANTRFHPLTLTHVLEFWRAPYEYLYVPLTYSLWAGVAFLSQAFTAEPFYAGWFHQLNLLLHLGAVCVVYRLGQRLVPQRGSRESRYLAAAAGAMLFALHPVQVEAVAWVSGLKDVLCGLWGLVALWQYVESVQASTRSQSWRCYSLATLAYGLALLAKPMAVVIPAMAWGLDTIGLQRSWRRAARSLGLWMVVAVLWTYWTKTLQPDGILQYVTPWWGRLTVAADALTFYLRTLVWPLHLAADYGRTPQIVLSQDWSSVTAVMVLGLGGMVWWKWQRLWRGLRLALSLFVGGLLPVLGLVPFMFQTYSTVADRYVYFAMLGPALGLACLLVSGYRQKVVSVVCGLLMIVLAWRSTMQVQVWHDTISLFTHTLQINPGSAVAHNNLGLALAQQGRVDAAIHHYTQALDLRPDFAYTHNNLGLALVQQGHVDTAIPYYEAALRLKPDYVEAYNNLGLALLSQDKPDEASRWLRYALTIAPTDAQTHNHLGITLAAGDKLSEAVTQFEHAIKLKPDYAKAYLNLGLVFVRQKRVDEAIRAFRIALQLRPTWIQAAINLAELLATHRASSPAAIQEAVVLAEQASKAMEHRDAEVLFTLALAYQSAGKHRQAQQTAQLAAQRAAEVGDTALAARIAERLASIMQGRGHD